MKYILLEKNERYIKKIKDPKIFGKVKYLQSELNLIIESNKTTTAVYQIRWLIQ